MSEAATLQDIRLSLGREPDLRLFRNQTGAFKDERGVLIRFGLCTGGSDLIGLRSIVITSEMVGRRVAIFSAIEVKASGGRHPVTPEQQNFIAVVQRMGGLAGVARSPEEARLIVKLHGT